jgi:hypothetical protein
MLLMQQSKRSIDGGKARDRPVELRICLTAPRIRYEL